MLRTVQPSHGGDDQVISFGRGERRPYERNESIQSVFRQQVERSPSAIAVVDERESLTYAQLDGRANDLAARLRAAGVASGTSVGIALERSAAVPVALLGILKAGGAYVPLDPSFPPERLEFMLADAAVGTIVTSRTLRAKLPATHTRIIEIDAEADAAVASRAADAGDDAGARALAYIMYTSGSTGRPKGVAIEHRGVVRLVRGADYMDMRANDIFLQYAPLGFDASTFEIWAPLLNGGRVAFPRATLLSMPELADVIERFGVTAMFLTTSLFQRLVDSGLEKLRGLRYMLTGGEVGSPRHMATFRRELPDCRLIAMYGPTENTSFSAWYHVDSPESLESGVPLGRPISNSTAYVLDAELNVLPTGVSGELCVGGDGVARGYLNLPDLTAKRFVPDPFSEDPDARLYRSGDRARWTEDGLLEFLGRDDDQVKIRGYRIELGEIESALQGRGDVAAAVVVVAVFEDEKALFAYVQPAVGTRLTESDLRTFLQGKLPPYAVPRRINIVDSLPYQSTGKVDRVALARRAEAGPPKTASAQPVFPKLRNAQTQAAVTALWRAALAVDCDPDADVNFFDAGGDSLQLLGLHKRLCHDFSVSFDVAALFEYTTIRKLAAFLDSLPRV
jgi:amino acid adenylation domain-containing protein